jgi:hypothetical protein
MRQAGERETEFEKRVARDEKESMSRRCGGEKRK